jgi:hypothetical protein
MPAQFRTIPNNSLKAQFQKNNNQNSPNQKHKKLSHSNTPDPHKNWLFKVTAHAHIRTDTATPLTRNQRNWLSEATAQTVAILHNSAQFSAIPHNS